MVDIIAYDIFLYHHFSMIKKTQHLIEKRESLNSGEFCQG